ncbi:hypothetical protein [Agrobacterium sp.]|uniref:hypothetical protein n=1 Tax=Agrobacterium sp. TaxID=361 RepID=UPI0028B1CAB2|nr:hypothetical protein [Agrobacterium sp.]
MTSPAQQQRDREKSKVSRLTIIKDQCRGDSWFADATDGQVHIIAKRSSGEQVVLATIYADALPGEVELISGALENTVMFLELRDRAIVALRSGQQQPRQGQQQDRLRDGDFAANAAMLCAEPLFHRFLERKDSQGAIYDAKQADAALKRVLCINSKTQLNREARAQTAFLDLRADYQAWKEKVKA